MFNVNVKDLPIVTIHSKPKQYADDTCLIKTHFSTKDYIDFESNLNNLSKWWEERNPNK
jgi:hypothetical protein